VYPQVSTLPIKANGNLRKERGEKEKKKRDSDITIDIFFF